MNDKMQMLWQKEFGAFFYGRIKVEKNKETSKPGKEKKAHKEESDITKAVPIPPLTAAGQRQKEGGFEEPRHTSHIVD